MSIPPKDILGIIFYSLAIFLAYFFLSGFIWGAGFEPTKKKDVDTAARLLELKKGMTVYDLGSGTGDVLLHLATKYQVKCVGYEIDPVKFWISKIRISVRRTIKDQIEIKREPGWTRRSVDNRSYRE